MKLPVVALRSLNGWPSRGCTSSARVEVDAASILVEQCPGA